MSENTQPTPAGRWLTFRPDIKVLDCTIRDGGLMNDHKFDDDVVKAVYDACVAAGIDYMEIGYINSKEQFPPGEFGPWKHSAEEDIRRIVGDNDTGLKLSAMADVEKSDYQEDILPCDDSVLDMIRIATYIHQMPLALEMIKDAHAKGYETTLNLMALSTVPEKELVEALAMLAESDVGAIHVVDSFGAFTASRSGITSTCSSATPSRRARRRGSIATTTASLPSATPSMPWSVELICSTPAWRASVAGRGTAPWSCS